MTRSELIEKLCNRFDQLTLKDVEISVHELLTLMVSSLAHGHRVEIRGFGSFSCHYRPPRIGRNPKSGARVDVPAKWSPHFKPGKELRILVDNVNK